MKEEAAPEIFYTEIAYIDYLLICKVKEIRIEKGISQVKLTQGMGLSEGFVGKVELFNQRAKYSIRHLPLLAKALKCKMTDLIPSDPPSYDMVRLKVERSLKLKKDGGFSDKKETRVIAIEPLQ